MRKIIAYFTAVATITSVFALALTVNAAGQPAAPGQNPLTCSEALPDNCTSNGKTATIDTTIGGSAAVFLPGFNKSFYGVRTSQVKTLSNMVTGDPLGIDPRWSIPIDVTDGNPGGGVDGDTDYFLFVSFADCNNGAGLVDVINDPTCTIHRSDDPLASYPNWDTFVSLNTNTNIAANDFFAFIIADGSGDPGVWTISNVKVGKPGK